MTNKKFIVTFTNPFCLDPQDRMRIQRGVQMAKSAETVKEIYSEMRDVEVVEDADWLIEAQANAFDCSDLKATEESARI